MCACSCFGNLESPKCLQSPGEDLVGKLWFILLNFISYHSSSYLSPIPTHTNYVPALHTQLVRTRMDKKHPVLQVFGSGISMLAASCHRGVDKKKSCGPCYCIFPHYCETPQHTPSKATTGEFKGPVPFLSCHFFSLPPFGSQSLRTRTFKNNCIYREN